MSEGTRATRRSKSEESPTYSLRGRFRRVSPTWPGGHHGDGCRTMILTRERKGLVLGHAGPGRWGHVVSNLPNSPAGQVSPHLARQLGRRRLGEARSPRGSRARAGRLLRLVPRPQRCRELSVNSRVLSFLTGSEDPPFPWSLPVGVGTQRLGSSSELLGDSGLCVIRAIKCKDKGQ